MSKDMLGPLWRAMVAVPKQMLGIVLDIANRLGSADGEQFYTDLKKFVRDWRKAASGAVKKIEEAILVLISDGEDLAIGATSGFRAIAQAKNSFPGYIDTHFKNWGLDTSSEGKEATLVDVYEMRRDATFADMFGSLGRPISELVLTQDQIIKFCEDESEWLRSDGYATFFLFEVNNELFVADVRVRPAGRRVRVRRFGRSGVGNGEYRRRVVVPQKKLSA